MLFLCPKSAMGPFERDPGIEAVASRTDNGLKYINNSSLSHISEGMFFQR